jgi:hypothetical protein
MPTKISTVGVGLLMLQAAAAPFASAERLSPLGPRALFHFSGLGPALMCSSHSQYSPAADYARCQSHPAVRRGRKEVKVEKPAAYSDQGQR